MDMSPGHYTIANYCQALDRGEIIVNKTYQRSDKVWPPVAQSFLIESIILGYPVPKISLHQKTDLKSRRTIMEIVDGQQRTGAIKSFFDGNLRLSRSLETEELKNRKYDDLEDEHQQAFMDYTLTVDNFLSATDAEVREVFRRMNSYTVTLNPEEQRHARYQGDFKWFIHRIARKYSESFIGMGIFGQKQLVRMADAKLLSEISHALLSGISTTNPKTLNRLYSGKDRVFEEEEDVDRRISESFDQMLAWPAIHETLLMKPYIVYALVLAITHSKDPVEVLSPVKASSKLDGFDTDIVIPNLTALAEVLANPEEESRFDEFVEACSGRTNVRAQREIRFKWLCDALLPERL